MNSKCPSCEFIQEIPKEYESREIKCTNCNGLFTAKELIESLSVPAESSAQISETPIKHKQPEVVQISRPVYPSFRRRRALVVLSIIVSFLVLSLVIGLRYGYKRGRAKGFIEGGEAVIEFSKIISEYSQPEPVVQTYYKPTIYNELPESAGQVLSADWKVVQRIFDEVWIISWQIKFHSLFSGKVNVKFSFYDSDGFLINSCCIYAEDVTKYETYTFTEQDMISKDLGEKIASYEAKVELR